MFKQARIKLTVQYLMIIMIISIFFSLVIYRALTFELTRIENAQRLRIELGLPFGISLPPASGTDFPRRLYIDPELIQDTKNRIGLLLLIINVVILSGSSAAAYYLAGITLKPIKDMLDEQNRFITDASHELRTPITALKSEIEVNLRDKNLKLSDAKALLKSNLEETNHLQSLTDELIKLTQYQGKNDEHKIVMSSVSLGLILDESINQVKSMAKNKKITLTNTAADFNIEANAPLLSELFIIFLDNAIKYSPKNSEIKISDKKTDGHVIVSIADSGMGISKEDISHIFDRFYRTDKSRSKTNTSGYGLGLSIAKQIIDKHHGFIKVQSQVDKGTTFLIELPLKQPKKIINI